MSASSELQWIKQTKQGDQAAFNNLIERYQGPVYTLCYRLLGNRMAAEDAAQETFIRAYYKLASFDEGRKFSSWLFAIAGHYCLDQLKRRQLPQVSWESTVIPPQFWGQAQRQPENALLEAEISRSVWSVLATLKPAYRTPLILKYWHAMSCQEIAQELNTTPSAIKSKLFRARKVLATALAQQAATRSYDRQLTSGPGQADPMAVMI